MLFSALLLVFPEITCGPIGTYWMSSQQLKGPVYTYDFGRLQGASDHTAPTEPLPMETPPPLEHFSLHGGQERYRWRMTDTGQSHFANMLTIPDCTFTLHLRHNIKASPRSISSPATVPTTIPAIAPPESPSEDDVPAPSDAPRDGVPAMCAGRRGTNRVVARAV
ncbi:uncharacterized protein DSM5745_09864 [Aspergillus mulundensis]|uniref:Uncharacterized protein n=1 Tax=Aspergillus mulundensis TaxID=1810919 RepID=A0A3D8QRK5_9EURO|nr:hypothetical protein DSM5745_09864 [Aspergillus mulundensis]RDW64453.1 hypothetical protein DSM5745_09864 [Aspergillus mulundensis]